MQDEMIASPRRRRQVLWTLPLLALLAACPEDGDDGPPGPPGPPGGTGQTNEDLELDERAPGIVVNILGFSGGTGIGGNFLVGDSLTVEFTVKKDDGLAWDLDELDFARAMVSGPTFNYQRVLAEVSDVKAGATLNADGNWTYTFADAIPATYLPPLNDTPSFGPDEGELAGQPLLDGTYTVGMYFGWNYNVNGISMRDAGDATADFLFGAAVALESREVVKDENCNRCHDNLQFHGGLRRATTLCLLCHTAGSEDRNDPMAAGGTPGVTVDFKVMVHKIHNGSHLPSVLGVTTDMLGDRDYAATPQPYQLVGFGNTVHDYSDIVFPAYPNFEEPMPRDMGYSALGAVEQGLEDQLRRGVTSCYLCHGDPDEAGPLTAPAQGALAFSQPSRQACGSCHEDWVFDRPYTANGATMPAQLTDGACTICHPASGSSLASMEGHLHPLRDPAIAMGVNLGIVSVDEAGTNDMDGTVDPGEKISVTFTIQDDNGMDVDPAGLNSVNVSLSGPTENYNILEVTSLPAAILTGMQPFTVNLPMPVQLEYVGNDAGGLSSFTTALTPHLNVAGAATTVRIRTGMGPGGVTTTTAVTAPVNYIDVSDASSFARDDYLVLDNGGASREYLQVQWVDGNRLWFSSPQTTAYKAGPQFDHPNGSPVRRVDLMPLTEGVDYSIDPLTGTITELLDFGNGDAVVVDYTTDYVLPSEYPLALNAGPDLTEADGGWAGKSIVDGTYSVFMWASDDLPVSRFGETNAYRELAEGVRSDFLVGSATTIEPYDLITSAESCYACHVDVVFHGRNRRGYESCLACHGTAASGDRPQYVAANAPATDGVTVNFREIGSASRRERVRHRS